MRKYHFLTQKVMVVVDASNPEEIHGMHLCEHPKLHSLLVMSALSAPYYT